jgi:Dyp-type peroxidase family
LSKLKYFDAIKASQAQSAQRNDVALAQFDFASIAPTSKLAALKANLALKALPAIYAVARIFSPILHLGGIYHITRDAQVRDVLSRPQTFTVPFGLEMAELAGGPVFALGLDGGAHTKQNKLLRDVIDPIKDKRTVIDLTGRFARGYLENSRGRIDAIDDVIKGTVSEVCIRYFGFLVSDRNAFADWTISASALLFGDPTGNPKVRELALNGAARLRAVFDASIAKAKKWHSENPDKSDQVDTIVDRLVKLQRVQSDTDPISDDQIRAILFGLVSGFIPTNTLAAGKMLDVLVRRPEAFRLAVAAAQRGQDGREDIKRILLEAGRLNPTLSPGQWRYCAHEASIEVDGRIKIIPAGSVLMVSTMSAMRDGRVIASPTDFDPNRRGPDGKWQEPDLLFGHGVHHCIGKYLAIEQITEGFMALLSMPGITPAAGKAGKLKSIGPFCRNLEMVFETPTSQQSMFLFLASVTSGASKSQIDAEIAHFGHPAIAQVATALEATGLVHFCSLSTIQSDARLDIVWELSVDGAIPEAIAALVARVGDLVRPIFAHCGLKEGEDLGAFLNQRVVLLHGKPWQVSGGATGLNFKGTGELSIPAIDKQFRFKTFVESAVSDYQSHETNRDPHAMSALDYVRSILSQDRYLMASGTAGQRALSAVAEQAGYDAYQMVPKSSQLGLSKFKDLNVSEALLNFAKSKDSALIWAPILALSALFALFFAVTMNFSDTSKVLGRAAIILPAALSAGAVSFLAIITAFLLTIRAAEKRDVPNDSQASLAHMKAIESTENIPGYAQNHLMAVGTLKPGMMRIFSHTLALWGIRVLIESKFRPGFVKSMGTIHFARWWRVPGTNKAAFFSNFDGSWESYLEDFVTRVSAGMTAAWSNWQGFPPTSFLIFGGAKDGGRFKRWVRTQQQVVPFWYSRFPALTTDHMRTNALIHRAIACARTNTEAEDWLRCFGSMPRIANKIEADEIQSLVFTGLKRLKFSACIPLLLPQAGVNLAGWLSWVKGDNHALPEGARLDPALARLLNDPRVVMAVHSQTGTIIGQKLANSLTVTFGDRPPMSDAALYQGRQSSQTTTAAVSNDQDLASGARAVFFGFSGAGCLKFEAPNMAKGSLAEAFPPAFQMGMAARGRSLGDIGKAGSPHWRWGDGEGASQVAEAILVVYAQSPEDLAFIIQTHTELMAAYGGKVIDVTNCAPARIEQSEDQHSFEHFGYRDGISQPFIKGLQRSSRDIPARDMVEPGEFILGYQNGQGFCTPSPLLSPDADQSAVLPKVLSERLSRFPDFGDDETYDAACDFGRNGSFLIVRELKQDVDGFEKLIEDQVRHVRSHYPNLYQSLGQQPDEAWVMAKLMGRWPSGRPLIGNPLNMATPAPDHPNFAASREMEQANDFSYGDDDPQGLACPFGAHVRRTNPRDSKEPGDKEEQMITNRHRLLRRGRTYTKTDPNGDLEKGLVFVALCTDIERQFEFVQQVWSNSPSFHGLSGEPDPITGADIPDLKAAAVASRHFSIPTPGGTVKLANMERHVHMMAGGYFFLPSRSALSFLVQTSRNLKMKALQ